MLRITAKDKKVNILKAAASFVPHRILNACLTSTSPAGPEIIDAVLLYSDISGFTAMSEKLMRMGSEGSEEVNRIINNFFQPIISIIDKWGGDVYRFGGDSILSFFPNDNESSPACPRALQAATEIINFVRIKSRLRTRVGSFRISIHSALARGRIYFQDLKTDYLLAGELAQHLMAMIDYAGPAEIVTNDPGQDIRSGLPWRPADLKIWKLRPTRKNYFPALRPPGPVHPTIKHDAADALTARIKNYLPEWLFRRIQLKQTFEPSDGEHRRATVVFLHYRGIPYDQNPRRAAAVQLTFYSALRDIMERYGGWLNALDLYKDSSRAMVTFGFPVIHGDDEQRACLFARELQNHPALKNLETRAGINAGSIFAGPVGSDLRREYAALGDAVNLAARLAAHAAAGTIQVSEAVYNKTFSHFEYRPLGRVAFKGKKQSIPIYQLTGHKEIRSSALSKWLSESAKLIGRTAELKTINEGMSQAARGHGRILYLTGEAGIGKSRLIQEMIKILSQHDFLIYNGGCVSYGSAFSFHPWIDILTQIFGMAPADSTLVKQNKIRKVIRDFDRKLLAWLPVIGEIMGVAFPETSLTRYLNAKIRRQRVFDIVFDLLKHQARSKPVALIIEDIHWIDPASLELVNYIGRNMEDKALLLTLVSRPVETTHEFLEKPYTIRIRLRELSPDNSLELIRNLLSIKDVPPDLRDLIVNKSQGNPFYIEELVKSLIEQAYIVEDRGGWKFIGDLRQLSLPDTVEAVILNRIDRLDLLARDVIQVASVLGREFEESLLKGIYPQTELVDQAMRTLQHLDLIRQEKNRRQINYAFKHIMTREAAYGMLSYAKRRDLHTRVGAFIESRMKNRREEMLGLLSHHYFQGGEYEKALAYSVEAGDRARKVYANEEAIEFYTRAIEAYENLEKAGPPRKKSLFKKP